MAEPNTLNMMTDTTDYASIQSFDAPSRNPKRPFKNILLTKISKRTSERGTEKVQTATVVEDEVAEVPAEVPEEVPEEVPADGPTEQAEKVWKEVMDRVESTLRTVLTPKT